ncbi:DUF3293 domain-containing protein [Thiothrix litoralis]|uniref:DUF3293 domain-containing protein n=1 Tax=Thiothrix litoralis TaxID=2891210 RepID=A0ABX7X3A6_9GAMM|nr:DUF3293 domain-containing protein [Thiothrix litoralis]
MAQEQLAGELEQNGYTAIPTFGLDPAGEWQGEESFLVPGLDLENAKFLVLPMRKRSQRQRVQPHNSPDFTKFWEIGVLTASSTRGGRGRFLYQ